MIPNLVRSLLFACATVFIVKHLPEQFIIRAGLIKCVQVGFCRLYLLTKDIAVSDSRRLDLIRGLVRVDN